MKHYYVSIDGKQEGPMNEEELLAGVAAGRYTVEALIWCEGMDSWEPISKLFPKVSEERSSHSAAPKSSLRVGIAIFAVITLLYMVGNLTLCVYGGYATPEGNDSDTKVSYVDRELKWYIGGGNWANRYDKFQEALTKEKYYNHCYFDGERRSEPLTTEEKKLYESAFSSFWSSFHEWSWGDLSTKSEDITNKLTYAHPSEIPQLRAELDQLQKQKWDMLTQYDIKKTMHMATFLAEGTANKDLSREMSKIQKMCAEAPDDAGLQFYAKCLNHLQKNAKLISDAIPGESQLYIIDKYEEDIADISNNLGIPDYKSPQKLVKVRKRLRLAIKQQTQTNTKP